MSPRPVVWAIVHDLERAGVPVALERLVHWHATDGGAPAEVHVVAGRDGPLRHQLAAHAASVTALEPAHGRHRTTSAALALQQAGRAGTADALLARGARHRVRHLPAPDVVLVQGAGAWRTFATIEGAVGSARVVLHLHELEVAVSRSGLGDEAHRYLQRPDLVLAVCDPVADLARRGGADPSRIAIVAGSVDDPPGGWDAPIAPTSSPTVVSIGAAGWRKGTDRAEAAAHELARTRPEARWHWVGETEPSPWRFAVGAASALVRHAADADPWSVVAGPAALVITSREDPLPLVGLEAGARGVPIVAARTGGLPELLGEDRGLLVDGWDLRALVTAVEAVLDDPVGAARRATRLRDHVRQAHATDVVGPRWVAALLDGR